MVARRRRLRRLTLDSRSSQAPPRHPRSPRCVPFAANSHETLAVSLVAPPGRTQQAAQPKHSGHPPGLAHAARRQTRRRTARVYSARHRRAMSPRLDAPTAVSAAH
jgi:hypothetical protein